MKIEKKYSLKKLNTFGLNAKADTFVSFTSEEDLITNVDELNLDKVLILGSGSNILFSKDFAGTILHSEIKGIEVTEENERGGKLKVGSGVIWDELVEYCVNCGYGGIENLSLIPGTVGAAPVQNIGAYGVELKDIFVQLQGFDLREKKIKTFDKEQCKFDYRDSIFKNKMKNSFIITNVILELQRNPKLNISYRAIKDYLYKKNYKSLDIKKIRNIVIEIRESKLPDPKKLGNAGSFFKNPIITKNHLDNLKKKFNDIVYFEINKNKYKIPAGWLIEKAGLKGYRKGNVGVHKDQALVLVNYGGGKGEELLQLSSKIKNVILNKFNISLETEVNII
ncbi:MAG: UDP-N-acetylenolpyruvoylglucosamine reductase [Ignavibacteriae bacterium]|nr:MAG: UDP-N-acetylenolpyruvoylglucosamine reductase [Ignavibacteriota bacterium]